MQKTGIYPILPTPFNDQGNLDLDSLRRLIDFQAKAGVNGVAILGFLGVSSTPPMSVHWAWH